MSYLGSKAASGAFQAIIGIMPPHDTYIETHLGSGAIMRNKPPCARSIGIDINPSTIDAFDLARCKRTNLFVADAVAMLDNFDYAGSGRVLIYSDPPYLHSTRTSRNRYAFEYTDDDHRRLIATLKAVPADVILSGYPSPLYDELLAGWNTFQFQVMTRGGVRTEQVWFNYEPVAAYWSTYAGRDFTDRQRIKRKAGRWAASFKELPPAERQAVFAALLQSIAEA